MQEPTATNYSYLIPITWTKARGKAREIQIETRLLASTEEHCIQVGEGLSGTAELMLCSYSFPIRPAEDPPLDVHGLKYRKVL